MKKGFTLIEIMLVTAIFTSIFAMILTILTNSDQAWRLGQDKLTQQQEARKAVDNVSRLLRQTNPSWVVNGTSYPVTISAGNTRIDFYQPIFDGAGNITTLKKITFKLNPDDAQQLLKKEGTAAEKVIANNISYLNFGGGCAGCAAFNCANVASDCPVVKIAVRAVKKNEFALSSEIALRNQNVSLPDDLEVEEPEEGEF